MKSQRSGSNCSGSGSARRWTASWLVTCLCLTTLACGPKERHRSFLDADRAGPLVVTYDVAPDRARRDRIVARAVQTVREYESDWGHRVPPLVVRVHVGVVGYVPCGLANSGGCYGNGFVDVGGGQADELEDLYHELHHACLEAWGHGPDGPHFSQTWVRLLALGH